MKPILKNRANLLTMLIMVQAAFIFSCSEDGTGCYLQENEDGTNTITCDDSSFDFRSGLNGTDGGDGTDGKNGSSGKDGEDGEKGDQGDKGNKGSSGDKGSAGADGVKGKDGEKGEVGEDGDDGINEFTCLNVESEDGLLEDVEYDFAEQFCQTINPSKNRLLDLCGGTNGKAYVSTQFCQEGKVKQRCGNRTDTTGTYLASEFCQPGSYKVLDLCGSKEYEKTEFCQEGTNAVLKLCGEASYLQGQDCRREAGRPGTYVRGSNVVVGKCSWGEEFSIATQRCGEGNIVEDRCGENGWYNYNSNTEYCSNYLSNGEVKIEVAQYGTLVDERNGRQTYKTVVIGSQTWMAENLNYDPENSGSSSCYGDNEANCAKYGRLYERYTAVAGAPSFGSYMNGADPKPSGVQGVCPYGWHIPSPGEWQLLIAYVVEPGPHPFYPVLSDNVAGTKLKSRSEWLPFDEGIGGCGTDDFGFRILPAGVGPIGGRLGNLANFATSQYNSSQGTASAMYANSSDIFQAASTQTILAWTSVRCVKDEVP